MYNLNVCQSRIGQSPIGQSRFRPLKTDAATSECQACVLELALHIARQWSVPICATEQAMMEAQRIRHTCSARHCSSSHVRKPLSVRGVAVPRCLDSSAHVNDTHLFVALNDDWIEEIVNFKMSQDFLRQVLKNLSGST